MKTSKTADVRLSAAQQRYVECIDLLCREHGHAHVSALADMLGVRMPSVTEVIDRLIDRGFVTRSSSLHLTLTAEGRVIAKALGHRHDTLRRFMELMLAMPPDQADTLACRLEHSVDGPFVGRVSKALDFLERHEPETLARLGRHLRGARKDGHG